MTISKILLMVSIYLYLSFYVLKILDFQDGEDEDFCIESANQNEGDDRFDTIVGVLQEILLDPKFESMTKDFSHKYCMEFDATEENKLCYTSIFKEY